MTTSSVHTLLPKIVPLIAGCNDDLAKIILADAARTFAREADIVIETRGFPETEAPEYGRMPEFAVDKDHFVPLHFISRNEDKVNKRVYLTYSLLPTADLMPESVIIRHYEAITSQALFQLYSMPGKPWTSADMAQLYLQKYRIALGDAMRDNNTGGAVFDQFMICCEPGDAGFIGAQNITATVIGTDTSDGNITPDVVLAGYKGYAKGEMVVGNIQMMPEPSISANVITVYAGLNQTEKTVAVPEAGALTVSKNKVTCPAGYVKSVRTAEIPVKSATLTANTVTIPEGYHNDQTLSVPVVSAVNDGEYVTIPVGYIKSEQKFKISGNTGVNVDFVTAEAGDILAGKTGTDKSGNPVYGNIPENIEVLSVDNEVYVKNGYYSKDYIVTIPTAEAVLSGNVVTIPQGYHWKKTLTVPEAKNATVSGNVVTIYPGYTANQYTATVPKATSSVSGNVVTIPAGYHDATTKTVAEMAEPTVSANVVTIPVGYNKAQKTKTITEAGQTTVSGNVVTTPVGYVKTERKTTVGTAKGAETITPGTADKTIAAGTYLTGALTVKGDADLVAENIAEGKEIFGIAGSFKGGSSGGGAKYYKCRSVHTGSKTWDGYEVTFDDVGISSISDTLTTGLTYGAIAPLRQNIYSADGVTQIRGALMSGGVPTPFYYVSGETPRGDIWYTTADEYINGDGDNKGFRTKSGAGIYHELYIDGKYISLPGFPVSASAHDWACAYWLFNTGGFDVLRIGTGSSGYPSTVFRFRFNQYAFDGSAGAAGTWVSFTPLFDIPTNSWIHIAVSYNSNERKYTSYINGEVYTQFVEQTAVERLFDRVQVIGTNNFAYSHLYFFAEQLTQAQAKSLAKQRWIFNGLYVSGLSEVYNEMYGSNVSPNGKLVENGTYMFKPKYYIADQYEMSIANVQWNGTQWEIYMDSYDADWNPVKLILATGEGGNDPSEASWTNTGYGLPTVTANYANGI